MRNQWAFEALTTSLLVAALACGKPTPPPEATPTPIVTAPPSSLSEPEREPEAGCRSERSRNLGHPSGEWFAGTNSKVCAALIEPASHDGSDGKTRIVFDRGTDAPQVRHELTGIYRIFSHSPRAHTFVIGGQFETGVFVLIERLAFIDDHDGSLRWSRYRPPLHVASVIASPDGDTLALVAAADNPNMQVRLWAYRIASDEMIRLGPAPGPPPDDWECDRAYPSRWLVIPRNEAYTDMDPGVISFITPDEVEASYGADTCKARAKKRVSRRWNIANTKAWLQPARSTESSEN